MKIQLSIKFFAIATAIALANCFSPIAAQATSTTLTLTSSANPSTYGANATLTATVTPSSATGTVIFYAYGYTFATVSLSGGVATYTAPTTTLGSTPITAAYLGSGGYTPSTNNLTVVVNPAPITIASGVTANNKVWDGTTTATLSANTVTFNGVLSGDAANVALSPISSLSTNLVINTLVNFSGANGANPSPGGLTVGQDGNFYGTTVSGGTSSLGTAFRVTTNGTLTTLTNFASFDPNGSQPLSGLTLGQDGNFYGTTSTRGLVHNTGVIYKLTTNGLLSIVYSSPGYPSIDYAQGNLALSPDGSFYGTSAFGGTNYGLGAVYRVTTNGTFTIIYNFNTSTGINPYSGLVFNTNDNCFYGTTTTNGPGGYGTVFRIATNGTFTLLANFINTNGSYPNSTLVLGPHGSLYGTTTYGGSNNVGTVFQVTTNGTLTTLVGFNTNNGANPQGALTFGPDGYLYGTTYSGGSYGAGTVFKVTTNGILTTLVNFSSNGSGPNYVYVGTNGNVNGTTFTGGTGGSGTVFGLNTNIITAS